MQLLTELSSDELNAIPYGFVKVLLLISNLYFFLALVYEGEGLALSLTRLIIHLQGYTEYIHLLILLGEQVERKSRTSFCSDLYLNQGWHDLNQTI